MTLRLTPEEIVALTGYAHSRKQLEELRRRGFWRAGMDRAGKVLLTRAHYEAVEAGAQPPAGEGYTPQLRSA